MTDDPDSGGQAAATPAAPQAEESTAVLAVPMGLAMPAVERVPVLTPPAVPQAAAAVPARRHSMIAAGLSFIGVADVEGSITLAGEMQGNIRVHGTPEGHVTITETGTLVGDVSALHISVLGQTVGTLDAAGGEVSLHGSSSVSGRVRYTHLQVNGADLNAQLERVRLDEPATPGQ